MTSRFSKQGTYYAHLSGDGKLKIWNTSTGCFEQEFTPDFHLTTPCTCLQFIEVDDVKVGSMPKKKKRKLSNTSLSTPDIALGTTSGLLMVYSIAKANVEYTINSNTSQLISCLSVADIDRIYSGADQSILVWSLDRRKVIDKWKAGDEKISSILFIVDTDHLVTASKSIKLWNVKTKEILKTFTGHSSEVEFLQSLPHPEKRNDYILSGSKGDRILNCWSLSSSDQNAIAGFLMEDVASNISIHISEDGTIFIAATVRRGVVHIYQHTLNGKLSKPIKAKSTIQIVTESEQSVIPLMIFGAVFLSEDSLSVGYGTENVLKFENVTISPNKKTQCLVRANPVTVAIDKQEQVTKTITPIVNSDVHYLTAQKASVTASKRKSNNLPTDIPMEKRLENLTLNQTEGKSKTHKTEGLVQLLVQGLHSNDKKILKTVLYNKNEDVIKNTVRKLPVTVLVPLIGELSEFIQGKTLSSQIGSTWLKHILEMHTGILISNPELPHLIGNILGSVQVRLGLLTPLNRLKGRLDLLLPQVSGGSSQDSQQEEKPLLMYNDNDSEHSDDLEEMQIDNVNSDSENEWEEDSNSADEADEHLENNVDAESDE